MKLTWAVVLLAGLAAVSLCGAEAGLAKKMETLQRTKNDARKEMVDCFKRIKNAATAQTEAPAIKKASEKEFAADVELMKISRENPDAEKMTEEIFDKMGSEFRDVEVGYQKEMKRLSGKEDVYKIVKQAMTIDEPKKPAEDAVPANEEKPAKAEK
jgi:hypothetical protein